MEKSLKFNKTYHIMETKTLAFNVSDLERFKDYFPDFKSGKMTGRELGSKLLEVLDNQASNNSNGNAQVDENAFNALKSDYQQLQEKYQRLETALESKNQADDDSTLETSDNQSLQDEIQRLQEQVQDALNVKNKLEEDFNTLKIENQRLQEIQNTSSKEFQDQCNALKADNQSKDTLLKDLKARLKDAEKLISSYAFTPFFKSMVETLTDRINELSGTAYTPTDVITQSLFATFYNSHSSIMYTYPISKEELLALAQSFYPELSTTQELFELMIHKVKEEGA